MPHRGATSGASSSMSRTRSRQQGVVSRRSDEELLLLDTDADKIHQLNPTAGFIWEKLTEGRSDAQIAQMLCDAFDVSLDQARADVEATVRAFREQGLLSSATDL